MVVVMLRFEIQEPHEEIVVLVTLHGCTVADKAVDSGPTESPDVCATRVKVVQMYQFLQTVNCRTYLQGRRGRGSCE